MEFVLVLPILFVIAVAVGDFGRVYASGVAIEDAAREAADYAAFATSNFSDPVTDPTCADPVCVKDVTRLEALRRACAAVSALPDFGSISNPASVAAFCADATSRCSATPGSFCELEIVDPTTSPPWPGPCGSPPQTDSTCGWTVHVTVTFDFHTALNFAPFPNTVHFVRDSRYAISALPTGPSPGP